MEKNNKVSVMRIKEQNELKDAEVREWKNFCFKLMDITNMGATEFNESADIKELAQRIAIWGRAYYEIATVHRIETGKEMYPVFHPNE